MCFGFVSCILSICTENERLHLCKYRAAYERGDKDVTYTSSVKKGNQTGKCNCHVKWENRVWR